MSVWDRWRAGLRRTAGVLASRLDQLVRRGTAGVGSELDARTLELLEGALLGCDLGVAATRRVLEAVRGRAGEAPPRELVKAELRRILEAVASPAPDRVPPPRVVFVVGVNGTGKTTTVAKLAYLAATRGERPLICAADTFRAAAVEQLAVWAARAGAEIVRARPGADPAAVVFDALGAARARRMDWVFVDTAGRLHTRANLMKELDKMRRVAAREIPGAPHEVLLVLDATVGQNGLVQAAEFLNAAGVTGIVLTKLDGTAKGGIAVAIAEQVKLPVRYVGVGEGIEDVLPFSPDAYLEALLAEAA